MEQDIPFAKVCFSTDEEKEVINCLRSGWITTGPRVREFEQAFAAYLGTPDAVAVSSGTAALHLALWAHGIGPGDEVITPSLTWVSVPHLVHLLGATPVFCDINPTTMNADPEDVDRLISKKTKVIVPVHFAGRPADMDRFHELAEHSGATIIEDACHALGAAFGQKRIGATSGLCCFSFHPNKNITTAEGGMLTGLDTARLKQARLLRFHGIERDSFKRQYGGLLPGYDALMPGLKLNMTDLAASLGLCQLPKLPKFNSRRAELVTMYRDRLTGLADRLILPPPESRPGAIHAWHLFTICVPDKLGLREQVMTHLLENKIHIGLHYIPVHTLASLRGRAVCKELPNTERVGKTTISLPLFPEMSEDQVDRVVATLKKALEKYL